ncbi:MAG: MBL fold metallo-hydrolase, partial [Pseudomonadales bacterium]|nr:MBL fold metallo-hydrolase [Pseudomonadales bacterium]
MHPMVAAFLDSATSSYSYVVAEPGSRTCAVIDPVLDFDPATGITSTTGADRIIDFVRANDLIVEWLLETHVHADHLSAGHYLKSHFVCAQTGIGRGVIEVQETFADSVPRCPDSPLVPDGHQFDRLLDAGEKLCLGHACGRVLALPGHTPACVGYQFDDFILVGDTLFMPDYGTA